MASTQKKQALMKNSESESDSEKEIQADFEGRNPETQDFHGIKQLLKQLFLKAHVDLSQVSDLLIAQTGVGSVLKQSSDDDCEDDDDDMTSGSDVFGITSVINLTANRETPAVKQLVSQLKQLAKEHKNTSCLELLNTKKIGLLINERIVNIPAKVADPLFTALEAEITRIAKREPSYKFDYYIIICKMYRPKGKGSKLPDIFSNGEEEIFNEEAELCFEYSVELESDTGIGGQWTEADAEMVPKRRVLFFKADKFANIVQKIKEFVGYFELLINFYPLCSFLLIQLCKGDGEYLFVIKYSKGNLVINCDNPRF